MPYPLTPLYGFSGQAGSLLEVKRLDVPSTAAPSARFFWLWRPAGGQWQVLTFLAMQTEPGQYRHFAEGELWFDAQQARWQAPGLNCILPAALPSGWQDEVWPAITDQ
ncbi:hypothetical protein THUN1379_11040 [Paludibacterium sp. THUN1379]|uniref:hypothetical protein n=1 Tax=Paludibacterium sp. THUN1379 TaxID=3112107 RepID=UPI00308877FF|nr:hypothetical protein THUN1379_11040 [Paludibacterium sp. THUN1379]